MIQVTPGRADEVGLFRMRGKKTDSIALDPSNASPRRRRLALVNSVSSLSMFVRAAYPLRATVRLHARRAIGRPSRPIRVPIQDAQRRE